MLRRFSGKGHNIVTLLATIIDESKENDKEYYILFPWAEGDLRGFWYRKSPKWDHGFLTWIANQCYGIVDAVAYIHDPPDVKTENGAPLFGRHGDIKAENILWFRGNTDILILSDLGLADVHREQSRSNLPPTMDVTREYRPPERDITEESGKISRSFDIWTLGCLFLEFVVWTLEGCKGIDQFRRDRQSPYEVGTRGVETTQYFDGRFVQGDENLFEFKVKAKVAEVSRPVFPAVFRMCWLTPWRTTVVR